MSALPHEPPFVTADLQGTSGSIGPALEDFRVAEVPAYAASGAGEHHYVEVEKRGMSTPELVGIVARCAGVDERDVGYAGLKDKHAITSQWLSLPARAPAPESWQLPANVRILQASRHVNKLRTGHLAANRFVITLVDVEANALERARAICERLVAAGLPNYFGPQRFGRGGVNLGRALEWLASGARARVSRFLVKLYPSVVQSEIFNRYLTLRSAEGVERLLDGDVVRLRGSQAVFLVENAESESARFRQRDILLTGPIWGPKQRAAAGRAAELENEAAEQAGADANVLATLAKFAPGTRRDLFVFPECVEVSAPAHDRIELAFTLPSGSYATVLVRELTRRASPESDSREA